MGDAGNLHRGIPIPFSAGDTKTGARQDGRGRFHLLLPAAGVTKQRWTSEGEEQLHRYSRSLWRRVLSEAAVLRIHGTSMKGSLVSKNSIRAGASLCSCQQT